MRSSDSFVVAVVEDGLSRSKKRSSLKDITDSKLAKLGFDFLSQDNQKDLQKTLAPQNTQRSTHWAPDRRDGEKPVKGRIRRVV